MASGIRVIAEALKHQGQASRESAQRLFSSGLQRAVNNHSPGPVIPFAYLFSLRFFAAKNAVKPDRNMADI